MKRISIIVLFTISSLLLAGCGNYSFTGANIPEGTETFQVNFFPNNAPIIEPGLDRDFTFALQDLFLNQTNLKLVKNNGDLVFEGEIVEYRVSPMSATANQTAAQNRLTIGVQVRYTSIKDEESNFDRRFSFFFDFPATTQLESVKAEAQDVIFERILQDIFTASLANW